jgi:hypothetical protein
MSFSKMSKDPIVRFAEQPAKIQFSVHELTQIAAGLSLQIRKTSSTILVFGGLFVAFNGITLGLLKKQLGPIALLLMREVAKRDAAVVLLNRIERMLLTGIDGRPTTFASAVKEVMEAQRGK